MTQVGCTIGRILRWRPVAPGGIPRLLIQDDYYEGYHLPKERSSLQTHGPYIDSRTSTVQGMKSALSGFSTARSAHSEMETAQMIIAGLRNLLVPAVGCALASDWRRTHCCQMLNMAKITWGFDVSAGGGETDWDVKTGYTDCFEFSPKRFPVNITARSEKHHKVFEAEFQSQRDILARFEN